jgi:hypothetical protein
MYTYSAGRDMYAVVSGDVASQADILVPHNGAGERPVESRLPQGHDGNGGCVG